MRNLHSRLVLLLIFLIGGLAVHPGSVAEPVKSKRKAYQSHRHRPVHRYKYRKHSRKARRIKSHRVPAEKSLALLRQYLPEVADIYETDHGDEDSKAIPVGAGYDFRSPFSDPHLRLKLITNINRWLGTRYRFGGSSKRGIDCSGFTSVVLSNTMGKMFAGSSRTQAQNVERVELNELQFGDLMFFSGPRGNAERVGHVGIYIGNGIFAHSSTGRGVIYTHISEGYYAERFLYGGRIIDADYAGAHRPVSDRL